MEVRLALTADYAGVDAAGKLNVIGFFSNLSPPAYPFTLPLFFVAFWLECNPAECGKDIQFEVILQDADGKTEIDIGPMAIRIPDSVIPGQPAEVPMVFRIDNWEVKKEGRYQWVLLVNGIEKQTMRLRVGPLPEHIEEKKQ